MRITIVLGFFLPCPPAAGGAVEKSWHRLAKLFAKHGHAVTIVSRQWLGWPDDETVDGVRFLRLPGHDHQDRLWKNLWLDFLWCLRVHRHLPAADVLVLNTISLACWVGWLRPAAGRVVVMPGRMPKGQFRLYHHLARILVPSSTVGDAVLRERPGFQPLIKVVGYPIDWQSLSQSVTRDAGPVTLGFVGRINREKGLDLLIAALRELSTQNLPPWRAIICGPADRARGGTGTEYLATLRAQAPSQVTFLDPIFDEPSLRAIYQKLDVFCYPSLADTGETFGVAVAEAMAAGAVPVVSNLACFRDFISPGKNGVIFDQTRPDAAARLTDSLALLIHDSVRRNQLAARATENARAYDFSTYSTRLLEDFHSLVRSCNRDVAVA